MDPISKSSESSSVDRTDDSVEKREVNEKVLPIKKKETKPKETKSKDSPSKSQQMKDLLNKKLDEGYQIKNKYDRIELQKIIVSELHLPDGSYSDVGTFLKPILVKRKIVISDLGFKDEKIGEVTVNLFKSDSKPDDTKVQSNIMSQSPHSALPKSTQSPHSALPKTTGSTQTETRTEQSEEPEKRTMSESSQEKLISAGLTKLILPLYTAVGIFELDEEEEKEEGKLSTVKQAKKDFEELAGEINTYLIENKIKLPAFLNHLAIIISIFVVMILPVIK